MSLPTLQTSLPLAHCDPPACQDSTPVYIQFSAYSLPALGQLNRTEGKHTTVAGGPNLSSRLLTSRSPGAARPSYPCRHAALSPTLMTRPPCPSLPPCLLPPRTPTGPSHHGHPPPYTRVSTPTLSRMNRLGARLKPAPPLCTSSHPPSHPLREDTTPDGSCFPHLQCYHFPSGFGSFPWYSKAP